VPILASPSVAQVARLSRAKSRERATCGLRRAAG